MFSYKLAKGTPLLEASWWKKRHGRSRSGLCKWSIKRAWNANKWTMAKCNIYTSFFSMLHTSFEVVVSLKVIFYPNGFLEKKNYAKTRPGSDFSTMSYRKGERNAMCKTWAVFDQSAWNLVWSLRMEGHTLCFIIRQIWACLPVVQLVCWSVSLSTDTQFN